MIIPITIDISDKRLKEVIEETKKNIEDEDIFFDYVTEYICEQIHFVIDYNNDLNNDIIQAIKDFMEGEK